MIICPLPEASSQGENLYSRALRYARQRHGKSDRFFATE